MRKENIAIPTCEISMDPETAFEIGTGWGVRHFEMKTLWEGRRVPVISEKQRDQLKHLIDDYGADIPIISPGLFIGSPATEEAAQSELAKLMPSVELANFLGSRFMIVFSFRKTEGVPEAWVVEKLAQVAEAARQGGITAVIEPINGNYCDSGAALARVIKAVGSGHLRVNWDAANVAAAGYKAYPDEYRLVRGLVSHVHVKNYSVAAARWALFDRGDVDLKANLAALAADGYDGYLAIETHTRFNPGSQRPLADSKANLDVLSRWLS